MAKIRCATTNDGNIEAAYRDGSIIRRVVIDPRLGNMVLQENAPVGSDIFRRLVRAAREHL